MQGTENVAWYCRKTGTGLVFPFSMATIGDPVEFPITVDHPRDPLNWYGRSKLLNERAIEELVDGAFPAHLFLKSNLYGDHEIDGERVSKGTVTNFFSTVRSPTRRSRSTSRARSRETTSTSRTSPVPTSEAPSGWSISSPPARQE